MKYKKRIVDTIIDAKLEQHSGVLLTGVTGCGRSETARKYAASVIDFTDEENKDKYLSVAETMPSKLLIGDKPRAFLNWNEAPDLWDAIRKDLENNYEKGRYILTGSEPWDEDSGRMGQKIQTLNMYPMSLYESGESNGKVSLKDLFEGKIDENIESDLEMDDLILAICRGGWPGSLNNIEERNAENEDITTEDELQDDEIDDFFDEEDPDENEEGSGMDQDRQNLTIRKMSRIMLLKTA